MIRSFEGYAPDLAGALFVADSALVMGRVSLGAASSVWYGAVLRGDVNSIRIGDRTNIQDCSVVHVTSDTWPTIIGDEVTVGHGAIVHGCRVGDRVLVGMGSVVLDGAVIGDESIVAAGAVVAPEKQFPARTVLMGNPARVVRPVREEELDWIRGSASHYIELARRHRDALAESPASGGAGRQASEA